LSEVLKRGFLPGVRLVALLNLVDLALGLLLSIAYEPISWFNVFQVLMLGEAGALLLVAGLIDLLSSAALRKALSLVIGTRDWEKEAHDKAQLTAARILVAGLILWVEALALTLAGVVFLPT